METVNEIVEEELVAIEDNLNDTEGNVLKETGVIVERLKNIIVEKNHVRALYLRK